MTDRVKIFDECLSQFTDENRRKYVENLINDLPDYFFTVAASSTGKYHPQYALGNGGLVRHTLAAVKVAIELLRLDAYQSKFDDMKRDAIIGALILHDGFKHGLENSASDFTVAEHPLVAADFVKNSTYEVDKDFKSLIISAISSHMGQWNTDFKTKKEILPKPKTELQKFVHLCDYIASRKWLEVVFDNPYNPEDFKFSKVRQYITQIISICKQKVADGEDRNKLYDLIAKYNGNKNPNSITSVEIAQQILDELSEDVKNDEN